MVICAAIYKQILAFKLLSNDEITASSQGGVGGELWISQFRLF